ncbi:MAG: NADH-quinone oxidoreductase subunit M, partial [Janthinobacterium lividum]
WIGLLAATTLMLGAAYTLWMYKRVYLGAVANERVARLKDIGAREFSMLAVLGALVLTMGLYPKPFTDTMHQSVVSLLTHVGQSKL